MTTTRQYAFTENDVQDPTQLAYLLNRLLSVTLSLKDTLDSITDGTIFKKVKSGATDGSGNLDLGGVAWVNKVLDNVGDGSTYARVVGTYLSTGKVTKLLRSSLDEPSANLFKRGTDNMDDVLDSASFGKVTTAYLASAKITKLLRSAIDEPSANLFKRGTDNMDDVLDSASFGKVTTAYLSSAKITKLLRSAVDEPSANLFKRSSDSLDDVLDGGTWKRVTGVSGSQVQTASIAAGAVTATKISVSQLSAIAADVGDLTAGKLRNSGNTAGVLLSGSLPGTWTTYLDFTATGANPLIKHPALSLNADGSANFSGTVSATSFTASTATFKDISQNWGGGTNATQKMFESGGAEVLRNSATSLGGQVLLWGNPGGNGGEYIGFGAGGNITGPTDLWTIGKPTNNDLYVTLNGSDLFKFNSVGSFQAPFIGTTATGANCAIITGSSNQFLRSTSSLRYKTDVRALAPAGARDLLASLRPIVFKSTAPADDPDADFLGLAAEDVAALDPRLVVYDEKGQPDGVQYDRLIVPVIAALQQLTARVGALETKVLV